MSTVAASKPAAVPSLFDPVDLGPVTAPNRIFFAPTSVGYAENGAFRPEALEHYVRRSMGGCGVVMTEHLAVSEEGWQHRRQPAGWPHDAHRAGLEQLAARIRDSGAVAVAQISHAGRYAGPWHEWASLPRLAPSAVPFPLLGNIVTPQEITEDQIAEVVAAFAATTSFLIDAGWQGVEIHGGSGFLISSFLSPLLNRRTDRYGGDVAGRVRFAQEVIEACQKVARGRAVIGMHMMTNELVPGGVRPADIEDLVPPLERAGVQFIRPGAGTFETLRLPDNAGLSTGTDVNRPDTDALVAVATVPIIANGGLRTAEDAEAALAGGASAVALARPVLADPDWAHKVRAGAAEKVVACPCNPPMCLQTQLTGAICQSWPPDVRERGYFGLSDFWLEDSGMTK